MKNLLAQQLEAFVKTLKAKRPEWDLIGDASVTAQQAGLQRLHELLLEVFERPSMEAVQKVLRLQWPELELAMQAARDLGWRYRRDVPMVWVTRAQASLYGSRARHIPGRSPYTGLAMTRTPQGMPLEVGLRAEFTVDVNLNAKPPGEERKRRGADIFDLYLSWPSEFKLTVPALQQQVERLLVTERGHWYGEEHASAWAYGPVQMDDVLDDEAREANWQPGQTYEVGLLCSYLQNCPYTWRSMVNLYEHAPFWFACVHDVIAQTEEIVGG